MSASRASSSWTLLGASFTERATLSTLTASILVVMYWGYAVTVAPLVKAAPMRNQHQPKISTAIPSAGNNSAAREMAEIALPHQPWAADAWYQVRTPHAYVYFQSWATVDGNDKAVRFKPFAVAWLQNEKHKDEPPITISAESAYVTFTSPFDISKVASLRLDSGGLEGDVLITGPNGLCATGRDFTFAEDAMRLWSDSRIEFAFEKHRGHARGVQIELIRGEQDDDETRPAVDGIKSIRFLRDVVMDLVSDRSDKPKPGDPPPIPLKKPKGPDIVKVRSDGSFEYVLETNIATFDTNVRIYRPNGKQQYDMIQSDDTIVLLFKRKLETAPTDSAPNNGGPGVPIVQTSATSTPQAAPTKAKSGIDSGLTLHKLFARGKNVVIASQNNTLDGRMTALEYDAVTRAVLMTNPLKTSFRTTNPVVVLKQKSNVMRSPEIHFHHDKDGNITDATCRGAGSLDSYDEETGQILEFSAEWKKELRKFPDKESPYDIIELEGQALIQQPDNEKHWGLAAEYIRVWMDRMKREKKPKDPAERTAKKPKTPKMRFALATQNVAFENQDMQSRTERLEVWFEERAAASAAPKVGSISQPARKNLLLTGGGSAPRTREFRQAAPASRRKGTSSSKSRTVAAQAFASTQDQPRQESPVQPASHRIGPEQVTEVSLTNDRTQQLTDGPIEVDADKIQVRVIQGADQKDTEVAEIWTKGNVRVKQEHHDGKEPLRLFGEQMHVASRNKRDKVLKIYGNPANVQNQGVNIQGNEIELDQAANLASVQGAGRLQLPVPQSLDGKPLPTPIPLDIYWKEKMTFDGLTARFFGQVKSKMNDERMKNEMRCQEMQVVMTEKLLFSGPRKQKDIRVRHINCEGHVEFDSDETLNGKIINIVRVNTARFSLDQTTGKTEAQGPGTISRWQFGNDRPQGLGPLSNVRANAPAKPDTSEWTYTRVLFSGKMIGNMNQRSSTFHDDVDILYGPVAKEMQTIDRDALGENAGWMGCELLTVTQHAETKSTPSYVELQARKNARLEGKTYNGRADSISYDGSKGQFVLRAEGNGTATIWTQKAVGGNPISNDAQQIEFNPKANTLKLNQVGGLNWVQ